MYSEYRKHFRVVLKHFLAGVGSCPLQEFLGNNFLRRYFSFKYNLLATKYLSRRMALSNQAPGFSPLLKNNSIVAFGERLLSEICQEIAQQNPTILVNTPPRAL